jgi:hypothetical protein
VTDCKHPHHDRLGRYCTCQPFSNAKAVVRKRKAILREIAREQTPEEPA